MKKNKKGNEKDFIKRKREKSPPKEENIDIAEKIKVIEENREIEKKEDKEEQKKEEQKVEKEEKEEIKEEIKEEKEEIKEDIKDEIKEDIKEEKQKDIKIDLNEDYNINNNIINDNIINIDNNANGSINLSVDSNCTCPYRCCIYCQHKGLGCCKCLNKIIKCPSCLRISDEEKKGILSSQRISIPQNIPEEPKKKINFQGIELADLRNKNDLNQSFNNISAPLITPVALPQFNNLENINLNENRENRRLNIIMFILYSILFIFMTISFRNHGGFTMSVTSSLYVLIAGLFVLNFSINFNKLLNK